MHKLFFAKDLQVNGTKVILTINDESFIADFSHWKEFTTWIGGENNYSKVKLIGNNLLEFPHEIHVEIEDFITLSKSTKQRLCRENR